MKADCHIHMVLDGQDWRGAIGRHRAAPEDGFIRTALAAWGSRGFTHLRDGGDRWCVGKRARELAPEYGITYLTPLAPLHRQGCYGGFIGRGFNDLAEYAALVAENRAQGCDFIKIMISGLMDFNQAGVLTQPGLDRQTVAEMIHIAHEEGLAVMAHANGAETVESAARAGVDSVEHGAYLNRDALAAMAEAGVIWVPTLSTVGNLLGRGRFPEDQVSRILDSALENVAAFASLGGILACGSDAGAWSVPHGVGGVTEEALLARVLGSRTEEILDSGNREVFRRFTRS